uniref:YL1_C domain-containing protein n=1 Tax=Panagrellus redivivus TaxID=6233 RepID=A0A7E4VD78_PANRE
MTASHSPTSSTSASSSSRTSISSGSETDSMSHLPTYLRHTAPIQQPQSLMSSTSLSSSSSSSSTSSASEPLPAGTVRYVATADEAAREYEANKIRPVNRPIQYDNGLYCYPTDTHRRQQYLDYLNKLPVSYFSHVPRFVWCGVREAPKPSTACDLLDAKKDEKSPTPVNQAPRISKALRGKKRKRY